MTKKQPSDELSWDEAVARYLEEHPEFFEQHTELLTKLRLRHPGHGQAISLLERQVLVLNERDRAAQKQLRELIDIARENDLIGERLHHFAIAMVDCGSLDDVFGTAQDLLRQEFRLDAVAILLHSEFAGAHAGRTEFVRADDPTLVALSRRCEGRRVVCVPALDDAIMTQLFAGRAGEIQSLALVALKDASTHGVLVLGSRDARRFHPEMGGVFVQRLGDLLMRACARHLRAAS